MSLGERRICRCSSHILSLIEQVIYMGVVLYAPSLALNAGEESQPLASSCGRLGNTCGKGSVPGSMALGRELIHCMRCLGWSPPEVEAGIV